jgi:outer membrane protein TolC
MGNRRVWIAAATASAVIAIAGRAHAIEPSADRARAPALLQAPQDLPATRRLASERIERLPPVDQGVRKVGFIEPARALQLPAQTTAQRPLPPPMRELEAISGTIVPPVNRFPIDLPTALQLADANNLQVAFAREQISIAIAQVDRANALWLPSVRGGLNYNRHEGAIQRVEGAQIQNSRGAFYAGLGAGGYGASSPQVPGLYSNFSLTDALFQPLAARQFAGSRAQAAAATTNDTLLEVALGYLELLRAGEDLAISQLSREDTRQLFEITKAYAETGEGLAADANRTRAELALRTNEAQRSQEAQRVASARLAQVLRLDPSVMLEPADAIIAPIDLVVPGAPLCELVAQGLTSRPELAENRLLAAEAVVRLRRERMAVLLPSIVMAASYGGMGAGVNEQLAPFHDRLDLDAIAYWEMRNFGFGEAAARRGAQANVRATRFRQLAVMDQVAREVVEAHAQVQSRKAQMTTARMGVEAAAASYQQNLERVRQSQGLPIEALQSIQALTQARRELLRTVIEYNSAQFSLYRALGWPLKLPPELAHVPRSPAK